MSPYQSTIYQWIKASGGGRQRGLQGGHVSGAGRKGRWATPRLAVSAGAPCQRLLQRRQPLTRHLAPAPPQARSGWTPRPPSWASSAASTPRSTTSAWSCARQARCAAPPCHAVAARTRSMPFICTMLTNSWKARFVRSASKTSSELFGGNTAEVRFSTVCHHHAAEAHKAPACNNSVWAACPPGPRPPPGFYT